MNYKDLPIGQLKRIALDRGIEPKGDRRKHCTWVDALQSPGPIERALAEDLPSEDEARSMCSQYFISSAVREVRNALPPERVFSPGERVRIISPIGRRNDEFCGRVGEVCQHEHYVWVWVDLECDRQKIVLCMPEGLEPIEPSEDLVTEFAAVEFEHQNPLSVADAWNPDDFGEVLHKAEPDGQLNLLEWDVEEPPEPGDFLDIADFWVAWDSWHQERAIEPAGVIVEVVVEELSDVGESDTQFRRDDFGDRGTSLSPASSCGNRLAGFDFGFGSAPRTNRAGRSVLVAAGNCLPSWDSPVSRESAQLNSGRCPCGAIGHPDTCDGETVTILLPDRIVKMGCFKHDLTRYTAARSPPGAGEVVPS